MNAPEATHLTEETPFEVMRRTWQPVALSADLPLGKVISYKLMGVNLVVARLPDGLLAADDQCPHKGMRLHLGEIRDGELQCPYHGWRFDAGGGCTNIPSLINPPPDKLRLSHLRTYRTQERYGMVWVQMEADETVRLPDVPEFENPDWGFSPGPPLIFKSGFRREIENYLDMTHFAFAHVTTLGKAASPTVPEMDIKLHDDGFQMDAPFPALETPHEQPGKLQSAHHRHQRCHLPNFTTIRQTFADGDERILLHVPCPNTLTECTCFWALALSSEFKGPSLADQIVFSTKVLHEDRVMCENQVPAEVPVQPSRGGWGVLVSPGDTLPNTFQQCFRKYLLKSMIKA